MRSRIYPCFSCVSQLPCAGSPPLPRDAWRFELLIQVELSSKRGFKRSACPNGIATWLDYPAPVRSPHRQLIARYVEGDGPRLPGPEVEPGKALQRAFRCFNTPHIFSNV